MGLIRNITDKLVVAPFAKRLLEVTKAQLADNNTNAPQAFPVPIGFNTSNIDNNRRSAGQSVTYSTLRMLSTSHETSRAAINIRKRQVTQLEFDIVDPYPTKGKGYSDEERLGLVDQFKNIGGPGVRFRELLDKLIEDTLVLDAFCFYKQKTAGGKLLRIIPIDATTIKLRVDETGLMPMAPEIAFEQWIMGKKVAEMTSDEMAYHCMNRRTNSPYGLSPLESLILTVDASLRASLYNTNYLSDNNVPQGFLTMPPEWSPSQIKEYKDYFDTMVSGSKAQAKVFPIPGGANYQPTSKPKDFHFKDFFDYLDRKTAMLFEITPQELGLSLQQYKENADSQEKIAMRKGLKPLAHFIEEIFTDIVQNEWGYKDLIFKFKGLDSKYSFDQVHQLITDGVISIDDVRNDMGEPSLGVENFVMAGSQIIPVSQIGKQTVSGTQNSAVDTQTDSQKPSDANSSNQTPNNELKLWETKAINDIKKKGQVYRDFQSDVLSPQLMKIVEIDLKNAKTIDHVKTIFKRALVKSHNPIEALLKHNAAKKFKSSVKDGLVNQIKPFTKESTIAEITQTKKAENSDLESSVEDYLDSAEFDGLDGYLKWAAREGGQSAYDSIGLSATFSLTNDDFQTMLGTRSNYLIDSVDKTTKQWIVDQISNGKAQGLTNSEIAQSISDEMDSITSSRADMIVNTEVANAVQTSELSTYKDQGITQKMWVLSEDINDECGENADQGAIGVDEAFSTGDDAPPAHPNCRCYIQAVFE